MILSKFNRAFINLADRRLTPRSREVSKPRDSDWDFSDPSEICQAPRQQRSWDACQISEQCYHYNINLPESRLHEIWQLGVLPLSE